MMDDVRGMMRGIKYRYNTAVTQKKSGLPQQNNALFILGFNKKCYLCKKIASSSCTSAIEIHFIALMDIDLGRDSAMLKQA